MNGRTLIFLLASLLLIGSAHAASLLIVESGVADGSYLKVKVSGIASATSLQFDLNYDPAVVSLTGIRKAEGYQSESMTTNTNVLGTARVLIIFNDPVTIESPTGVVEVAFSSVSSGAITPGIEDARWSDYPNFKSIVFDNVSAGTITSTISAGGSSGGSDGGSDGGSTSPSAATVTVAPTVEPTWDPGFLSTEEEGGELPTLPESTPAPVQTELIPSGIDAPVIPESTPAPAPLALLPLLFIIPYLQRVRR